MKYIAFLIVLLIPMGCVKTENTLPVEMTLTDGSGRKIEATIISRNGEMVTVVRNPYNKKMTFNVAVLSLDSRRRILEFPEDEIVSQVEIADSFLKQNYLRIETLNHTIVQLEFKLEEFSGDRATVTGINQEIDRLNLKISKIMKSIDDYLFRES